MARRKKKAAAGNGAEGMAEWAKGIAELVSVPPGELVDSPLNPRRTYDKESIDRIASTAKDVGILETLMARRIKGNGKAGPFELVFGHRRKRAAVQVGLAFVPVLVRDGMTDQDVLVAQLIENGQREDPAPVEEADAYSALNVKHKMPVEDIAAKVGKSIGHVYRRLALTHLCDKGRKALASGKIRIGVAELVAKLGDPKDQTKCIGELQGTDHQGALATVAAARAHIERAYLLELKHAPFNPRRKDLVTIAGSCVECPKRTGANADLFGDLTGAKNTCTDAACYDDKAKASWVEAKAEAKKDGTPVLAAKATADVFHDNGAVKFDAPWVDLDASAGWIEGKERTHRQALKAAKVEAPPVTLARDPRGRARELVNKKDLAKASKAVSAKAAPSNGASPSPSSKPKASPAEAQAVEAARRAKDTAGRLLAAGFEASDTQQTSWWAMLVRLALAGAWHDTCRDTCKRHGWTVPKGGQPAEVIDAKAMGWLHGKDIPDGAGLVELLGGLALELLVRNPGQGEAWESAAAYYGLKFSELEAAELKLIKGEVKVAAAKKKADAKAKAKAAAAKKAKKKKAPRAKAAAK